MAQRALCLVERDLADLLNQQKGSNPLPDADFVAKQAALLAEARSAQQDDPEITAMQMITDQAVQDTLDSAINYVQKNAGNRSYQNRRKVRDFAENANLIATIGSAKVSRANGMWMPSESDLRRIGVRLG